MNKAVWIAIVAVALSFAGAFYFYGKMPDRVASHWNASGEVDGYMPKFWGVFLMPIVSVAVLLLLVIIPAIDPKKKNIDEYRPYFDWFIALMMLFLLYIYSLTIAYNLGHEFDMGKMIMPALGVLFYYIGILMGHAKMNWTIGIRTPWTLSDEKVWDKPHKLGGKLFKAAGIISILSFFMPDYQFIIVIVSIMLAAIVSVVYSYLEYRNAKERKIK